MKTLESVPNIIGPISLGTKVPGKPDVGNPQVRIEAAGAGNVIVMGARLRPRVKTMDKPLDPKTCARLLSTLPAVTL